MGDFYSRDNFMRLFFTNQRRLFAYILMFIPNRLDAEDLLQETATWMWENFDKYTPGTSFGAWGVTVARYKIMNFTRNAGNKRLKFREDVVELIDARSQAELERTDSRATALENCLTRLPERDRWLIHLRYEKGLTVQKLSSSLDRPVRGLYKTMARIHKQLNNCIRQTLSLEGEI